MAQDIDCFTLKNGECVEDLLLNGLKIIQSKDEYRFNSDSVYLANFVDIKSGCKVVEFCSGCGVISILVNEKRKPESIFGLEINENLWKLSEKSLVLNHIENIKFVCDDLKNAPRYMANGCVDCVVCNPPYFDVKDLNKKGSTKFIEAKYEVKTNLEDIFATAKKILKDKGKFYICYTTSRIQELLYCANNHNFALKKLEFIVDKNAKKQIGKRSQEKGNDATMSKVFLAEFVKKAKSGSVCFVVN